MFQFDFSFKNNIKKKNLYSNYRKPTAGLSDYIAQKWANVRELLLLFFYECRTIRMQTYDNVEIRIRTYRISNSDPDIKKFRIIPMTKYKYPGIFRFFFG